MVELVVAKRPRSKDDEDDGLFIVCDAAIGLAVSECNVTSVCSPSRSPSTLGLGLLGLSAVASPDRGWMTAVWTGGGLSNGRSNEEVVDEEIDVLPGDVVVTSARVRAMTVATARVVESDVRPLFCTNQQYTYNWAWRIDS